MHSLQDQEAIQSISIFFTLQETIVMSDLSNAVLVNECYGPHSVIRDITRTSMSHTLEN